MRRRPPWTIPSTAIHGTVGCDFTFGQTTPKRPNCSELSPLLALFADGQTPLGSRKCPVSARPCGYPRGVARLVVLQPHRTLQIADDARPVGRVDSNMRVSASDPILGSTRRRKIKKKTSIHPLSTSSWRPVSMGDP